MGSQKAWKSSCSEGGLTASRKSRGSVTLQGGCAPHNPQHDLTVVTFAAGNAKFEALQVLLSDTVKKEVDVNSWAALM